MCVLMNNVLLIIKYVIIKDFVNMMMKENNIIVNVKIILHNLVNVLLVD